MRLGSSVKYTHTREELLSELKAIRLFSHLYDKFDSILDSEWIASKEYYIIPYDRCNEYVATDHWMPNYERFSKIIFYKLQDNMEAIQNRWGITCVRCNDIYTTFDYQEFKKKRQPLRYANLGIYETIEYNSKYALGCEFCIKCQEQIVDAHDYLYSYHKFPNETLYGMGIEKIIEITFQFREIFDIEQTIDIIRKEVTVRKKIKK